jgi:hypothetical protein
MPTKIKTPAELQAEAHEYFRTLRTQAAVAVEIWATDEDAGDRCQRNCHRVGHVIVSRAGITENLCVPHTAALVLDLHEGTVTLDIARPILIPDELAASEDLLELTRNFLYFIADNKGATISSFIYERATALGNRADKAMKARGGRVPGEVKRAPIE